MKKLVLPSLFPFIFASVAGWIALIGLGDLYYFLRKKWAWCINHRPLDRWLILLKMEHVSELYRDECYVQHTNPCTGETYIETRRYADTSIPPHICQEFSDCYNIAKKISVADWAIKVIVHKDLHALIPG